MNYTIHIIMKEFVVDLITISMFFLYNSDHSNWMRFVRPADSVIEQNLVLSQEGNHLFYTTTRSIEPKEELRVTYSEEYARKRGLELFASSDPQNIFDRGRKIMKWILSKLLLLKLANRL